MESAGSKGIENIRSLYLKLNSMFYKYSNEVTGILMSTLARENYLLIGPPGTAKTTLVYVLSKLLNARWFYRQLTKFTDLEEILGPIDVAKLLEGKVERIYVNSIVESDFALLDEIFNASSAILNTLLSLLNERVVYDGDKVIPVKTWTVFGSSNRIPEEEELQALYDRFPLRIFTEYAAPEDTEALLTKGWYLRRETENLSPVATMELIRDTYNELIRHLYVNISDVAKVTSPIIADFIEHVPISNRTRIKVPLYALAYLMIQGFPLSQVNATMLKVAVMKVSRYLVHDKEQLSEYDAFLTAHLPDELLKVSDLVSEAKALLNNNMINEAAQKIKEAEETLNRLKARWDKSLLSLYMSEIDETEYLIQRLRGAIYGSEQ
ncbi:AAA family ATPase [Caldivirga sp.]|uniref:AAA family ATPase n=1 Tax=Caldivirga sp. TaxID=2080243 RepID=UPI003D11A567